MTNGTACHVHEDAQGRNMSVNFRIFRGHRTPIEVYS